MKNLQKYVVAVTGKIRLPAFEILKDKVQLLSWQHSGKVPQEQFEQWLQQADALYSTGNIKITDELLTKAPKLKVIAQASVGYDNIDIKACTRRRIRVGNTPGVLADAVADLAYGLVIDCARKIVRGCEHVKSGKWGERKGLGFGSDLKGKTLGIVGMGSIGAEIAARAKASKMQVIYFNRNRRTDDEKLGVKYVAFDELLAKADFIVISATLNPSTRKMFNADVFSKMKKNAMLINVARGAIVDTEALYNALKNNQLAYAALDVVDPEPLPGEHELLTLPNITITPHIAAATMETRDAMAVLTAENILAGLQNQELPAQINKI